MQIADLTVSIGLSAPPVASSPSPAASDFFRLFGEVMRGDVGAAQMSPASADDSGVPSGGSVAAEAPADPSTGLRTGLKETMAVSEVVRPGSSQASGDGRDATALDQSGAALALAFLAGTGAPLLQPPVPSTELRTVMAPVLTGSESALSVSTAAFERLAEERRVALTPAGAGALDMIAVSQFSEAPEAATPVASVTAQADQHPLTAEPQGRVTHSSSLAVTLSAADAISSTSARLAEEPPRGPGEEDSIRIAPQGKLEATARPNEAAPLKPVLSAVEGAAPSVVPDAAAISDQRTALSSIERPALSQGEGPVLSGSTPLTTGLAEGPVLSRVEGGPIAPRLSTESAGLSMAASDETANSGEGATAITVSHDRPDGMAMEERPQPAAQPGALRDRLGMGQERLGSGSESEDGSPGVSSPAPGSDHGHGSGSSFGEVSSMRADAPRPGASAVAEHDRSLTLQVTQQIVAAARLGLRGDGTSVRLRLRPESLGELLIKISWKEKGIVAAIQAESPVTAKMLQEDLGHLKAALGERGIAVNDLGVQVGLDLRYGGAHGDRLPETTTSGMAQEARPWLPRDEVLPIASLIQREGLIDIRV